VLVNKQNEYLFNNRIEILKGGEGLVMSRGFFFQKLFKSFHANTFGKAGPAILSFTMTCLFLPFQSNGMIFTY
jgi:hypothetical protein